MIYLICALLIGLVAWREWEHDKKVNQLINGITGRAVMITKKDIDKPIRIDPALEKK